MSIQMLNKLKGLIDREDSSPERTNTQSSRISTEEAIRLLSSSRRRQVVTQLYTDNDHLTVRELSESLANLEGSDRKTVYIALYQSHLQKLDEKDVINWSKREGTLERGSNFDPIYRVLTQIQQELE